MKKIVSFLLALAMTLTTVVDTRSYAADPRAEEYIPQESATLIPDDQLEAMDDDEEEVNIPSWNLKRAILMAFGLVTPSQLDTDKTIVENTPVTRRMMRRLKYLSVEQCGVHDLKEWQIKVNDATGLEYATNLEQLSMAYQELNDLSALRGLTKLEHLDIRGLSKDGQVLTDISFLTDMTNLKFLAMKDALPTDTSPLNGLTKMEHLDMRSTKITNADFVKDMKDLQYFNAEYSYVKDLEAFRDHDKLEALLLSTPAPNYWETDSNNHELIKDLSPLENLTSLKELDIQNHKVEDISVLKNLKNLELFSAQNNNIKSLQSLLTLPNAQRVWVQGTPAYPDYNTSEGSYLKAREIYNSLNKEYLTKDDIAIITSLEEDSEGVKYFFDKATLDTLSAYKKELENSDQVENKAFIENPAGTDPSNPSEGENPVDPDQPTDPAQPGEAKLGAFDEDGQKVYYFELRDEKGNLVKPEDFAGDLNLYQYPGNAFSKFLGTMEKTDRGFKYVLKGDLTEDNAGFTHYKVIKAKSDKYTQESVNMFTDAYGLLAKKYIDEGEDEVEVTKNMTAEDIEKYFTIEVKSNNPTEEPDQPTDPETPVDPDQPENPGESTGEKLGAYQEDGTTVLYFQVKDQDGNLVSPSDLNGKIILQTNVNYFAEELGEMTSTETGFKYALEHNMGDIYNGVNVGPYKVIKVKSEDYTQNQRQLFSDRKDYKLTDNIIQIGEEAININDSMTAEDIEKYFTIEVKSNKPTEEPDQPTDPETPLDPDQPTDPETPDQPSQVKLGYFNEDSQKVYYFELRDEKGNLVKPDDFEGSIDLYRNPYTILDKPVATMEKTDRGFKYVLQGDLPEDNNRHTDFKVIKVKSDKYSQVSSNMFTDIMGMLVTQYIAEDLEQVPVNKNMSTEDVEKYFTIEVTANKKEDPETPVDPDQPTDPENPTDPEKTDQPTSEETIAKLKEEIEKLKADQASLQDQNNKLQEELASKDKDLQTNKDLVDQLQKQNQDLADKTQKLQDQIASLQKALQEAQKQNTADEQDKDKLAAELAKL
ncbi:MAG: hypothetical protein SPI59_00780, partial [Finegoldia sp.]|nr:hypothetical protein [Finegoldia sp.]